MSDFFIFKNWKWISKSRWFWRYSTCCPIPWEFVFENFTQILKLRGLRPYAWAFYFQNQPMCFSYHGRHFDMRNWGFLFDFTPTHAILTPVKSIFWTVFDHSFFWRPTASIRLVWKYVKFNWASFDVCGKFAGGCPPAQTPTQKSNSWIPMLTSQGIGSSLVSFQMTFWALQSELFRLKFEGPR